METTNSDYQKYIQILQEELIPSTGCTEPISLAYAAARCRSVLGQQPDKVLVQSSGSIIKNVKSVYVPNTGGLKGIEAAVAAGIVAGDPDKELEVITRVTPQQQAEITAFVQTTDISVEYLESDDVFDFIITLDKGPDRAYVRVTGHHTNLVHIEKNGEVLLDTPSGSGQNNLTDRDFLTMEGIWNFATTCQVPDIQPLLDKQIQCNMAIAKEGLHGEYGACIGAMMLKEYGNHLSNRAAATAAAGSDARMSGCEMPVIINSGSGNQGITCSVPVIVYAEELGATPEQLYRALALSNLTTIYQKNGIGCLSAFCGVVCAGVGAGVGITYLKGGGLNEISHTVVNTLATLSGMVCDGAKASCAAKIALAVNAGILGHDMYAHGHEFYDGEGLVSKGVDNTIRNISRLGRDGMRETNEEIIKIMICQ